MEMRNLTENSGDAATDSSFDESAYSIFFGTYNPQSPSYSENATSWGVTLGMLKFLVEGIGITSTSIFGVIGNILSIIVLLSRKMRNSSSCFLLFLAFSDIVMLSGSTLLIGIPSLLVYHPSPDKQGSFVFNGNIVEYGNHMPSAGILAVTVSAIMSSTYLIMALTLERYLAVCKPFYARYLCTWARASLVSLIIIIGSIVYNLPRWWEFTYVVETINNFTLYRPFPTALRINSVYDTYYIHVSYSILVFFVPVSFLISFNILIYREIKKANTLRQNLSHSQKHENSLTRMLFGVVVVFLMCQITPIAHLMYRYAAGNRDFLPETQSFWMFLLVLNSSVNFLIYCATGAKFREVFCETFCWCGGVHNRVRRFASSTKTTLRSLSISSNSRSRTYSMNNLQQQQQTVGVGVYHVNIHSQQDTNISCVNPPENEQTSTIP